MKYHIIIICLFLGFIQQVDAQQKMLTKSGHASFFSKAPLEDIEAHNHHAVALLDLDSKKIAVKMLIKQFDFEKSLMQEHFNENYMESDQYPAATFSGSMVDAPDIQLGVAGTYEVKVVGEIEIHGVKKPFETMVQLKVEGKKILVEANFKVTTADFEIEIPKLVIKNIAEVIDVKLICELTSMNS